MEIVEQAFKCSECRRLLEKPVAICCGQTVCLKHVENLENDVFYCKPCEQDHRIEKSSINVNKGYELLINANIKNINLGVEYKDAFELCQQLDRIIPEAQSLTTDPSYFINDSMAKLKNKTEVLREQHKLLIDEQANKIVHDLDKFEKECRSQLDSTDFKTKITNFNNNINQIKNKLDDWKKTLNDFGSQEDRWKIIKRESKKAISDFRTHSNDFKNQLLLNKVNQYLSAVLDFRQITNKLPLKVEDDLEQIENLHYQFKHSNIINKANKEKLLKLCGLPPNKKWRLIYRASEHGFSAVDFHSKCDNVSNTLTVIKSSCNHIFGGYTSVAWDKSNAYKTDSNAFLFSLVNSENKPEKLMVKNSLQAVYCGAKNGPTFGKDELSLGKDMTNWMCSLSSLGNTYPKRFYNEIEILASLRCFSVSDMDIYQII